MLAAFSQCLAAMLLITYAHALTFSMNRTEHAFSAKPAALGSAIPMNGGYLNMGLYYITIGLGTPQQMVNLHVDTGSSTLGVYASDCASCASSNVLYSMTASSTSSVIPCSNSMCNGNGSPRCLTIGGISQCAFTVTYGDASQMQGVLAYDVVTMGTKSALAVIGRIESSRAIGGGAGLFEVGGVHGIIGFGHSNINCNPSCFPTVLDAFNSAGLLTPYVFGMCMTPTTGSLEIGTIDPGKYSGSLTYLPFQTTGSLSGYYTVTMSSSKLGTANLLSSSANVIFDSGTTLIIGTTQWVNAFRAAAQNANAYAYASLFLGNMVQMSTAQINTWPVLTFTFPSTTGSYTVSLPPSMYIANQGGYGWLGVDLSGGQSFFIMGDIFLQALYVVYDNTNSRLGVAPVADCSHVMSSCAEGYYSTSSASTTCLTCASGTYCPAGTTGTPAACTAGSYCTTAASQVSCNAGSYCPAGSTVQTACSVGSYCPTTTSQLNCATPGSYCPASSTTQSSCPGGSYCSTTSTITACAAGVYCPAGSTSVGLTCASGSYCPAGTSIQSLCPAGYYCSLVTTKSICVAGTYCVAGSTVNNVQCTVNGSYCPAGSSAQNPCPGGYYCPTVTTQTICAIGTYCVAGSTANNVACTSGKYCAAGSSSQTACPAGSYCSNPSSLGSCSASYYCPTGSTSSQQFACTFGNYCSAGSGSQSSCYAGTYCPTNLLSAPVTCTAGKYCATAGLTAPSGNCTATQFCPAGTSTATACTPSLAGCPATSDASFGRLSYLSTFFAFLVLFFH